MKPPKVSIILPVFNKQNSIRAVFETLRTTIEDVLQLDSYELVFVDDASTDNSRDELRKLSSHPMVRVLCLPQNQGQLKAIEAGLRTAEADIVIITSCDLQNPLPVAAELYLAITKGYDCCIAYRKNRTDKGLKNTAAQLFLLLLSQLFKNFPRGGFDFVAINSNLKRQLLQKDFSKIFLQLEILKSSHNTLQIPITRTEDQLDSSSWTFRQRVHYAFKAIQYLFR